MKKYLDIRLFALDQDRPADRDVDLLALYKALDNLAKLDERQAKIVEMRYFGGLSIEETAEVLHVSPATVKRDWKMPRLGLVGTW